MLVDHKGAGLNIVHMLHKELKVADILNGTSSKEEGPITCESLI